MTVNLIGQKFNRLTVISKLGSNKFQKMEWDCLCDCGNRTVVITSYLRSGHVKSCGCFAKEQRMKARQRVQSGQVHGYLTVLQKNGKNRHGQIYWDCLCKCGITKKILASSLIIGRTKSCGCYNKQMLSLSNRKPVSETFWSEYCDSYKSGAKSRGYEWELTLEHVMYLATQNCHYCGIPPTPNCNARNAYIAKCRKSGTQSDPEFAESKVFDTNGIDRMYNNIGYTLMNCVPCCSTCNYAKRDMTKEHWESWMDTLTKFRSKPNAG